jgi:hypothetical protein
MKFLIIGLGLVSALLFACAPAADAPTATPRVRPSSTPTLRPTVSAEARATQTVQMATLLAANPTRLSGINYKYDNAATEQDRKIVERGVELAKKNFGDVLQVTIHAYGDFNALCDAYSQFENRAGCSHLDEDMGMASGNGGIYINISSEGWQRNPDPLKMKTVLHEYVHIVQFYRSGGAQHFKPDTGPEWLVEGSAEFLSLRAIDNEHLIDFNLQRNRKIEQAKLVRTPLGITATGANAKDAEIYRLYALGFLATEFLAANHGGEGNILKFYSTISSFNAWPNAFKQTFGISIDEFYTQFEDYRQKNFPPNS